MEDCTAARFVLKRELEKNHPTPPDSPNFVKIGREWHYRSGDYDCPLKKLNPHGRKVVATIAATTLEKGSDATWNRIVGCGKPWRAVPQYLKDEYGRTDARIVAWMKWGGIMDRLRPTKEETEWIDKLVK